jgi:hypothetical protein
LDIFWGVFFSNFVYPQEELVKFGFEVKEEVFENYKNPTTIDQILEPIVLYIW